LIPLEYVTVIVKMQDLGGAASRSKLKELMGLLQRIGLSMTRSGRRLPAAVLHMPAVLFFRAPSPLATLKLPAVLLRPDTAAQLDARPRGCWGPLFAVRRPPENVPFVIS
jgi:hypothetical protein